MAQRISELNVRNHVIIGATGDAQAAHPLDVVGHVRARNNLYVGTGGGYFYSDSGSRVRINTDFYTNNANTYIYGDNTYLGDSSGDNIYTRGNTISGNRWSINGNGQIVLNRDGLAGDAITINHVENNDWAIVFRSSSVGNDNDSGFWVNGNGTPDMRLRSVDGTVRVLVHSQGSSYFNGGNVGIGTTSPARKLHVSTGNSDIAARFENTTSNGSVLELKSSGDGKVMTFQTDHIYVSSGHMHLGNDTGDLYLRTSASGKVGIGTTSPSQKLHVAGNADIDGYGLFGANLKIGTNIDYGYYQDSTNGAYRANGTDNTRGYYFQSYNGANTRMYVGLVGTYAGRVGINTTSPARELHVIGSIRSSSWLRVDGSAGLYFESYGGGWNMTDSTWIRNYNSKAVLLNNTLRLDGSSAILDSYKPDTGVILQSYNSSATGSPAQFYIRHSSGNVELGNSRGDLSIPSNTLRIGSSAYITPVGVSMDLRKVNAISFAPNNSWNDPTVHGIMSTDHTGTNSDDVSINSYNDVTIRLDANNNNAGSYLRVYNDTAGNGGELPFWTGANNNINKTRIYGYLGVNAEPNESGYVINMGGSIDMNNGSIDYLSQIHFNDNVRFYDQGDDSYLNFKSGDTGYGGIILRDGSGNTKGYGMYWDANGNGVLNSSGSWGLRIYPGSSHASLYYAGSEKLKTESYGARTFGSHRVNDNIYLDNNYGSSLVGAYSATRYQGIFAMGDAYKLSLDGTSTGTLYGLAWTHSNIGGESISGVGP